MFSRKQLAKLIIPLIIEQILGVTIGMADTMMVSSVGEAAVSGISLVDSINVLLINIFSALATGGAVVASQYLGRRDLHNARAAAKQLIYSTTVLALVLMAVSLAARAPLLRLVFGHIEPDVMGYSQIYFLLSALSYPFLAVYNGGAALFRSMGNSKVSMFCSLLMNLINISGNALCIFVFRWGVVGAGLASLVSRAAGAVIMMVLLRSRDNPIYIERLFRFELKFGMIRNILRIGVPNGLENGMFQVGKVMTQSLVATFGTVGIAANAVAGNLACLELIPGMAIGLAMITVVGQCVGARDYDQAVGYVKKLMVVTYAAMGAISLVVFFTARPLVGLYGLQSETADLACRLVLWHSLFAVTIWPPSFALPNGLRAANDAKFTMLVSIFSMWAFRIGFSYLFAKVLGWGVIGVWAAMFCDWFFRAVLFVARFVRGKWKNKQYI